MFKKWRALGISSELKVLERQDWGGGGLFPKFACLSEIVQN